MCGKSFQVGPVPSGNDNRAPRWGMEGRAEQLSEARALGRCCNSQALHCYRQARLQLLQVCAVASGASPSMAAGEALVSGLASVLGVPLKLH